ncbi:hydroxysteroid 11-beta-dehydrogenase 1-like protein isoform X3 [Acanthaster planci]|uniref:Hydroxysteroid 11-beta-dehydrogenase 1-like protein isoform X3 n=1 Tax=Acanthaster planci TaxID=133434 RepID=A0A8B7Z6V0_ACAPL|nr:hydroxysteroid 11-beta-dehydrogenase 1-like protein isoform X3 [Acanthaster planci]
MSSANLCCRCVCQCTSLHVIGCFQFRRVLSGIYLCPIRSLTNSQMGLTKYLLLGVVVGYVGFLLVDRFDPASINGKRVVITGASTGIGEQIAYQYARLGARVLITARRGVVLQQVVSKCKELGAQEAFYLALDMSKENDTRRLIDEAKARFGGLDHLILNHVAYSSMSVWSGGLAKLRSSMDVNFHAYVSLATFATPMLAESKGSIGIVSSGAGKVSLLFATNYCPAKFALHGFFDTLRQEFQLQNIEVSVTMFVLGAISTQNAIDSVKGMVRTNAYVTMPSETAYRIMTGTANREREVYYPLHQTLLVLLLRDSAPRLLEALMQVMVKPEAREELLKNPNPLLKKD